MPGASIADVLPAPSPWQSDASYGPNRLELTCDGIGPCDRGYRLIVELADASAGPVDVAWHVEVDLQYPGSAWPSGATGTVTIDDAAQIAGPPPQLVATAPSDRVTVGPEQPATARLVEVRIGAGALSSPRPTAVASLTVSVVIAQSQSATAQVSQPNVIVYPLETPATTPEPTAAGSSSPTLPPGGSANSRSPAVPPSGGSASGLSPNPSPLSPGGDPFAGCAPGVDCVRQFVVAISWVRGDPVTADWDLTLRRVDLARVWTAPAQMSARILRRFDVEPGAVPARLRFDGDSSASGQSSLPGGLLFTPIAESPSTDPVIASLPVPGVVHYTATLAGFDPSATPGPPFVRTQMVARVGGGWSPMVGEWDSTYLHGSTEILANPFSQCRVGERCPDLFVATDATDGSNGAMTVRFHWMLDVSVYSYAEVPVGLGMGQVPLGANSVPSGSPCPCHAPPAGSARP